MVKFFANRFWILFKLWIIKHREVIWYQYFPKLPKVINFNANDICNSKCTMCNIWKQKQEYEVSPNDLKKILQSDLYREVEFVGITGGEPTMREDIADIFESFIVSLPKIKGVSIITNAIKGKAVKKRLQEINDVCLKHKVDFGIMVSVDGVGEVHDKQRGVVGNFESALEVIKYARDILKVPTTIGSTITKLNVWDVDELLHFAICNNIKIRFRVAEFIKRLYNEDRSEVIKSFSKNEIYNLYLFFRKLELKHETNEKFKRTYRSIQQQLQGNGRKIGCPYKSGGVVLNSRGEISYCAPKSEIIGSSIETDSLKIYRSNLRERRRIIDKECSNCIHDYHHNITFEEYLDELKNFVLKRLMNLDSFGRIKYLLPVSKRTNLKGYSILIVGWYGTETVGDKAILAGIIYQYKKRHKDLNIVIASIDPVITHQTIEELNISAAVIDSRSWDLIKYSKSVNEVIMGGGPLMDLNELYIPLYSFQIARMGGAKTTIFGCGVGPIKTDSTRNAINKIISNSDQILLRDKGSIKHLEAKSRQKVEVIDDPARTFLLSRSNKVMEQSKKSEIACFLREWTYEYSNDISLEEFNKRKFQFEKELSESIIDIASKKGINNIRFYHMHNYVLGNDDRDFSRYFIEKYFADTRFNLSYDKGLSTVDGIIEVMTSSQHNICMRFHSVLFAHTLNTSFSAIDYTLGGKIFNYLTEHNKLDSLIHFESLN